METIVAKLPAEARRETPGTRKPVTPLRLLRLRLSAFLVDSVLLLYIYLTGRAFLLHLPPFTRLRIEHPAQPLLAMHLVTAFAVMAALSLLWGSLTTSLGARAAGIRSARRGAQVPLGYGLLRFVVNLVGWASHRSFSG